MATQQPTAPPTLERSGRSAREELRTRPVMKLDARQRGILWAVLAALCLALWALVIVAVSLIL